MEQDKVTTVDIDGKPLFQVAGRLPLPGAYRCAVCGTAGVPIDERCHSTHIAEPQDALAPRR